jgi:hypothetical protein
MDEHKTNIIEIHTTTVVMDLHNCCNEINYLYTSYVQKAPEQFSLTSVITNITYVTTVNFARVSID